MSSVTAQLLSAIYVGENPRYKEEFLRQNGIRRNSEQTEKVYLMLVGFGTMIKEEI